MPSHGSCHSLYIFELVFGVRPLYWLIVITCTMYITETLTEENLNKFIIDFSPPKGVAASVSKQDLILGLREPIAHPHLTEFR
jgi:hypothetical protein